MLRKIFLGVLLLAVAATATVSYVAWKKTAENARVAGTYALPADRFVEVEGLAVRVREQGPQDAPVLLMLHGFTFSLESVDLLADRLDEAYRVVRYALRGHGLTGPDPAKRYSPDQRAAHIGAVMDALGIETATLVGNSLGGLAAWKFAVGEPGRVDNLVLISPGAYPMNGVTDIPADIPPALAAYFMLLPEEGIDLSIERIYAKPEAISAERKASLKAMMRAPGNGQAFIDALKVFTLPDPEPDLARIAAPTLIIWGTEDVLIAPTHGERIASAIPGAELVLLDGVGHVAHEEDPVRVAAEITRFLAAARDDDAS